MLKHLYVKDFVLIDECSLDFTSGFSAFTGETGAGKSLLIDAMCLLAGERASASFVKQDKAKAVVEGVFELKKSSAVHAILAKNKIASSNTVTLRREIGNDGKSIVTINGKNATLTVLKECVQYMIDIHSQHDTQYLLNKNSQLHLVDQMIDNPSLVGQTATLYQNYASLKKEYENAMAMTYNEDDLEFIQAEIQEIENAHLDEEEEEELLLRQSEIQQFEKTFNKVNEALTLLEENDGINEKLYKATHALSACSVSRIHDLSERLDEYTNEILDVTELLKDCISDMNVSEEEINELQERLYQIQRMKRKYGPSIRTVLLKKEEMLQQVQLILNRSSYIEDMENKIEEAYHCFYKQAKELSLQRKKAAEILEEKILENCQSLMLPNARFVIDFQETDGNKTGIDDLEFYISMNPGEMPRPLARVASGGELSRLMLGLKDIFTRLQGIETVIFDEIDTGVSGAVATAIGEKMHSLSKDAQVFSVTHLAQVAACAKNHYLVKKQVEDNHTSTKVVCLNEKERIEQLALISSGTISDTALLAANELYTFCQNKCNGV